MSKRPRTRRSRARAGAPRGRRGGRPSARPPRAQLWARRGGRAEGGGGGVAMPPGGGRGRRDRGGGRGRGGASSSAPGALTVGLAGARGSARSACSPASPQKARSTAALCRRAGGAAPRPELASFWGRKERKKPARASRLARRTSSPRPERRAWTWQRRGPSRAGVPPPARPQPRPLTRSPWREREPRGANTPRQPLRSRVGREGSLGGGGGGPLWRDVEREGEREARRPTARRRPRAPPAPRAARGKGAEKSTRPSPRARARSRPRPVLRPGVIWGDDHGGDATGAQERARGGRAAPPPPHPSVGSALIDAKPPIAGAVAALPQEAPPRPPAPRSSRPRRRVSHNLASCPSCLEILQHLNPTPPPPPAPEHTTNDPAPFSFAPSLRPFFRRPCPASRACSHPPPASAPRRRSNARAPFAFARRAASRPRCLFWSLSLCVPARRRLAASGRSTPSRDYCLFIPQRLLGRRARARARSGSVGGSPGHCLAPLCLWWGAPGSLLHPPARKSRGERPRPTRTARAFSGLAEG